jgi:hypothetical protein
LLLIFRPNFTRDARSFEPDRPYSKLWMNIAHNKKGRDNDGQWWFLL